MIKVPGTPEGLPANRELLADGINVNITLLFAQAAMKRSSRRSCRPRSAGGQGRRHFADRQRGELFCQPHRHRGRQIAGRRKDRPRQRSRREARLNALKGKIAVANAKLAYQRYLGCSRRALGSAQSQRRPAAAAAVGGSTGTKNKAYSDVLYVEELIGPDTVNTMPVATLEAFRDHGRLRDSLTDDAAQAQRMLGELGRTGISLDAVTDRLVDDGVRLFADAADKLLAAVAKKRIEVLDRKIDQLKLTLGHQLDKYAGEIAEDWRKHGNIRKLWRHDESLWTNADEDRFGWAGSRHRRRARSGLTRHSRKHQARRIRDAVLLASAAPAPRRRSDSGDVRSAKRLAALARSDFTVPARIKAIEADLDLGNTLFIVSSKSGQRPSPTSQRLFFQACGGCSRRRGGRAAFHCGDEFRFAAATGGAAAKLPSRILRRAQYRRALLGCPHSGSCRRPLPVDDVARLVQSTRAMMRSCGPDVPPAGNPSGAALGIALGAAASRGRDKITIRLACAVEFRRLGRAIVRPSSTGKHGKGLIPIDGEPLGRPDVYGDDRFFIELALAGDRRRTRDKTQRAGKGRTSGGARIAQNSIDHIGQEFFRFEIATAIAGAVLGINPFDQPDVEASKVKTRELTAAFEQSGTLPRETPVCSDKSIALYTDEKNAEALRRAGADGGIDSWLKAHFAQHRRGDYAAVLAYLRATRKPPRACSGCGSRCATG